MFCLPNTKIVLEKNCSPVYDQVLFSWAHTYSFEKQLLPLYPVKLLTFFFFHLCYMLTIYLILVIFFFRWLNEIIIQLPVKVKFFWVLYTFLFRERKNFTDIKCKLTFYCQIVKNLCIFRSDFTKFYWRKKKLLL